MRLFEAAGAAAIQLEDQLLPKRCGHLSGEHLVDAEAMAAKVRAAAAPTDADFMIVARTDAHGVSCFDDALRRVAFTLRPVRTSFFPEALESGGVRRIRQAIQAPLLANITEFGRSPNLDFAALTAMGYRIVLYPVTALRRPLRRRLRQR